MLKGWNLNQYNRIFENKYQTGICFLLISAIVLSLFNPGTNLHMIQPQAPFEDVRIDDITILEIGENLKDLKYMQIIGKNFLIC